MRTLSKILGLVLFLASPLLAQPPGPPISPGSSGGTGNVTASGSEVCVDNQIIRSNGTAPTALQCSVLTVADTTGNLTGPAGGFSIIGGTGATDDLTLDGSAGTAGNVSVSENGVIKIGTYTDALNYNQVMIGGDHGYFGTSGGGIYREGMAGGSPLSQNFLIGTQGDSPIILATAGSSRVTIGASTTPRMKLNPSFPLQIMGLDTDTNNYERLSLSCDGTADCTIATETAGTGSDDMRLNLVTGGNAGVLMRKHVTADIDGETTTAANSGTVWTNTGDGDGESITLLNDPTIGVNYCFAVDAAQTITVAPSTGESLYYGTDQCVVSLTSNSTGSTLCVTAVVGGSGGKWFTMSHEGSWTCND